MSAPTLAETTRVFARIGLLSFGGPAAQIALMHRELVEKRPWMHEQQFLGALSFCMLLPGPEAMQLATYAGWRFHGIRGGLIAGLLFVIPGAMIVLSLAMLYAAFGQVPFVYAMFLGVKATVVVIVIEALLRVARKALSGKLHWLIAALSFIGIFLFDLPFPAIIAMAALLGLFTSRKSAPEGQPFTGNPPWRSLAIWLAAWWVPIGVLWLSGASFLTQIAMFFSKLAVVTFGGAYAVLAYMTQAAVSDKQWLSTAQMMDGLGLAETTPGPLILVTEFVGYTAGVGEGGVWLGIAAALVALWVTFIPCFLWIFTFAPYVEWITSQPRFSAALRGITAAVVGVILNLSVWFSMHVFFADVQVVPHGPLQVLTPDFASINWQVVALAIVAAVLLLRFHANLMVVLLSAALGGLVLSAL